MLLSGKTVVITGSNRGIGREILKIFSENGANIFACSRNIDDQFRSELDLFKKNIKMKLYP